MKILLSLALVSFIMLAAPAMAEEAAEELTLEQQFAAVQAEIAQLTADAEAQSKSYQESATGARAAAESDPAAAAELREKAGLAAGDFATSQMQMSQKMIDLSAKLAEITRRIAEEKVKATQQQ